MRRWTPASAMTHVSAVAKIVRLLLFSVSPSATTLRRLSGLRLLFVVDDCQQHHHYFLFVLSLPTYRRSASTLLAAFVAHLERQWERKRSRAFPTLLRGTACFVRVVVTGWYVMRKPTRIPVSWSKLRDDGFVVIFLVGGQWPADDRLLKQHSRVAYGISVGFDVHNVPVGSSLLSVVVYMPVL